MSSRYEPGKMPPSAGGQRRPFGRHDFDARPASGQQQPKGHRDRVDARLHPLPATLDAGGTGTLAAMQPYNRMALQEWAFVVWALEQGRTALRQPIRLSLRAVSTAEPRLG